MSDKKEQTQETILKSENSSIAAFASVAKMFKEKLKVDEEAKQAKLKAQEPVDEEKDSSDDNEENINEEENVLEERVNHTKH